MSEFARMMQGLVYDDFSEEMNELRRRAKKLFKAYNATTDEELERREEIKKELFAEVGERVWIEPDFRCEFGSNIVFGHDVYVNFGAVILDCAPIRIGNNVLIGPNLGLYAANHCLDPEERMEGGCYGKPITIEDGVWIGGDVKVLQGVTIGKNSIIGAGSIVNKDIPENVIAAGNPCKVIRPLSDKDKTDYLQYKKGKE